MELLTAHSKRKITRIYYCEIGRIIVEVTNRFKELDLIVRVPEELWTEVCDIVQEAGIKTTPKIKKCKKAKCLSEEALQKLRKEEK